MSMATAATVSLRAPICHSGQAKSETTDFHIFFNDEFHTNLDM